MLSPLPLEVKIPLAIASHVAVDMLGEAGLGQPLDIEEEGTLHIMMCVAAFFTGHIWQFAAGMFLANLIDTIDKIILKRCWIHCMNWYPPLIIQFTVEETIGLNVLASVLVTILMMWVL